MPNPIPFEDFVEDVRRAVVAQEASPVGDRLVAALNSTGHSCVIVILNGGSVVVCEGWGCYCPGEKFTLRSAFEVLGKCVETRCLKGGVLLAWPPMQEFLTDWNLRTGDYVPIMIIQTPRP